MSSAPELDAGGGGGADTAPAPPPQPEPNPYSGSEGAYAPPAPPAEPTWQPPSTLAPPEETFTPPPIIRDTPPGGPQYGEPGWSPEGPPEELMQNPDGSVSGRWGDIVAPYHGEVPPHYFGVPPADEMRQARRLSDVLAGLQGPLVPPPVDEMAAARYAAAHPPDTWDQHRAKYPGWYPDTPPTYGDVPEFADALRSHMPAVPPDVLANNPQLARALQGALDSALRSPVTPGDYDNWMRYKIGDALTPRAPSIDPFTEAIRAVKDKAFAPFQWLGQNVADPLLGGAGLTLQAMVAQEPTTRDFLTSPVGSVVSTVIRGAVGLHPGESYQSLVWAAQRRAQLLDEAGNPTDQISLARIDGQVAGEVWRGIGVAGHPSPETGLVEPVPGAKGTAEFLNPVWLALGPLGKGAGWAARIAPGGERIAPIIESYIANAGLPGADHVIGAAFRTGFERAQVAQGALRDFIKGSRFVNEEVGSARLDLGMGGADPNPGIVSQVKDTSRSIADPAKSYDFNYKLVEANDLIASHTTNGVPNPAYPEGVQPRARERVASQAQVDSIAANLEPDLLLSGGALDRGTPIVAPDSNVVESGNGRVGGILRAISNYPDRYAAYRDQLQARAAEFGFPPGAVAGMEHPVLVRARSTPTDQAAFAGEANFRTSLEMSPAEKAMQDANRLNGGVLRSLRVGENQTIDQALLSPENDHVRSAILSSIPAAERAALADAEGRLNRDGLERIKSAIFAKTFPGPEGQALLERFRESLDPGMKNIEAAVFRSLPQMARAQELVRAGERAPDLNIGTDLAQAVTQLARLKQIPDVSIGTEIAQMRSPTLFGGAAVLGPEQARLMEILHSLEGKPKQLTDFLNNYARGIEESSQLTLGGGVSSKADLMERAAAAATPQGAVQSTLGDLGRPSLGIENAPYAGANRSVRQVTGRDGSTYYGVINTGTRDSILAYDTVEGANAAAKMLDQGGNIKEARLAGEAADIRAKGFSTEPLLGMSPNVLRKALAKMTPEERAAAANLANEALAQGDRRGMGLRTIMNETTAPMYGATPVEGADPWAAATTRDEKGLLPRLGKPGTDTGRYRIEVTMPDGGVFDYNKNGINNLDLAQRMAEHIDHPNVRVYDTKTGEVVDQMQGTSYRAAAVGEKGAAAAPKPAGESITTAKGEVLTREQLLRDLLSSDNKVNNRAVSWLNKLEKQQGRQWNYQDLLREAKALPKQGAPAGAPPGRKPPAKKAAKPVTEAAPVSWDNITQGIRDEVNALPPPPGIIHNAAALAELSYKDLNALGPYVQTDIESIGYRGGRSESPMDTVVNEQLQKFPVLAAEFKKRNTALSVPDREVAVDPARLAQAPYKSDKSLERVGKGGDIAEAVTGYREQKGGMGLGSVASPAIIEGKPYVATGTMSTGREGILQADLHEIVPRSEWTGPTYTYGERAQMWGTDVPRGDMEGVVVRVGGRDWVMLDRTHDIRAVRGKPGEGAPTVPVNPALEAKLAQPKVGQPTPAQAAEAKAPIATTGRAISVPKGAPVTLTTPAPPAPQVTFAVGMKRATSAPTFGQAAAGFVDAWKNAKSPEDMTTAADALARHFGFDSLGEAQRALTSKKIPPSEQERYAFMLRDVPKEARAIWRNSARLEVVPPPPSAAKGQQMATTVAEIAQTFADTMTPDMQHRAALEQIPRESVDQVRRFLRTDEGKALTPEIAAQTPEFASLISHALTIVKADASPSAVEEVARLLIERERQRNVYIAARAGSRAPEAGVVAPTTWAAEQIPGGKFMLRNTITGELDSAVSFADAESAKKIVDRRNAASAPLTEFSGRGPIPLFGKPVFGDVIEPTADAVVAEVERAVEAAGRGEITTAELQAQVADAAERYRVNEALAKVPKQDFESIAQQAAKDLQAAEDAIAARQRISGVADPEAVMQVATLRARADRARAMADQAAQTPAGPAEGGPPAPPREPGAPPEGGRGGGEPPRPPTGTGGPPEGFDSWGAYYQSKEAERRAAQNAPPTAAQERTARRQTQLDRNQAAASAQRERELASEFRKQGLTTKAAVKDASAGAWNNLLRLKSEGYTQDLTDELYVAAHRMNYDDLKMLVQDYNRLSSKVLRGAASGFDTAISLLNLRKAIMASLDMSWGLRQGVMVSLNPMYARVTAGGFKAGGKALFSGNYAEDLMHSIETHPLYDVIVNKMGVDLTEWRNPAPLTKFEEEAQSHLVQYVPGINQSNRSFTAQANKVRFDLATNWIMAAERSGRNLTDLQYRNMGLWINVITGRGELGKFLSSSAPLLNALLFAPRFLASRIEAPLLPLYFAARGDPRMALLATRDLALWFGTSLAILKLTEAAGAKVEWDPRSSDFLKITEPRTGITVDPMGGYTQLPRLLYQVWSGERIDRKGQVVVMDGKGVNGTPWEQVGKYFLGKGSPNLTSAYRYLSQTGTRDGRTAKDIFGQEITLENELNELFPLGQADLVNGIQADRDTGGVGIAGAAIGALSLFGVGIQVPSEETTPFGIGSALAGIENFAETGIRRGRLPTPTAPSGGTPAPGVRVPQATGRPAGFH